MRVVIRSRPARFGLVALIILATLLALDLSQRGLAWRLFWSLTGEETPVAQLRGMVEVAGNLIRAPLNTEPLVAIAHTDVCPFGINTFLEQEVEPAKRERQLQMIREAGFCWIRQQFPWEDIEIHARGDFEDRRNVDAIGVVSAWDKYDQIVALAEQYGVQVQARLDNPPAWSRSDPNIGAKAPPDDVQDFVNYAVAVAQRYRGRIRYYQVWNEPNIYPEWGEQSVSPEDYTDLLCRTYNALKAVDPSLVVISGALAPTVSLTGRDLNDFIFLQRMYDAGAGACFDILAAQGYGFNSGAADQRLRPTYANFARHQYLRDLMVANGDASKPIWISEAAWNPIDAPEVPPDVSARDNFGVTTPEQAARYMPLGYQRMQEDWSWVGVMHYWFFKRAADYERGQSWYYFRMVEPDFTLRPIYDSMRAYLTSLMPTLYRGVHQASHWAIQRSDDAAVLPHPNAQLGDALRLTEAGFTAHGTRVTLRWLCPAAGQTLRINDAALTCPPAGADAWREDTLHRSFVAETHAFRVTADAPFTLDSITVDDRSAANILYLLANVTLLGVGVVGGVMLNRRVRKERREK